MPRIRLTPVAVKQSAAVFSRANNTTEQLVSKLTKEIEKLEGRWAGLAKTRFAREWPSQRKTMSLMADRLGELGVKLGKIAHDFEERDRLDATLIGKIPHWNNGRELTARATVPAPRIYIINGITNAEGANANGRARQMANYWETKWGYDPDQIKATVAVYNKKDSGHAEDINDIDNEMDAAQDGRKGEYTNRVYNWILKDLAKDKNPLVPGQRLILIGHSGGGAIASNLAPLLEGKGKQVDAVVTLGSPRVNWDLVKPTRAERIAVTDSGDPYSNKADSGDAKNIETHYEDGFGPDITGKETHNSYMTSATVAQALRKELDLQPFMQRN